jgi:outer membrane protein OmpA-like peptidoglycan-associated protein
MLDELDDGARIGVWTALGVVALLLFGLLGGLAIKQLNDGRKPVAAAQPSAAAPAAADALLDVPLVGDVAGTLYFDSGVAALGADMNEPMQRLVAAVQAAGSRKLLISGFHDATGDPAKNAELAKERAKTVREALKAAGVAADRIALRKPESTTGDGSNREARRVEVRLMPQ